MFLEGCVPNTQMFLNAFSILMIVTGSNIRTLEVTIFLPTIFEIMQAFTFPNVLSLY